MLNILLKTEIIFHKYLYFLYFIYQVFKDLKKCYKYMPSSKEYKIIGKGSYSIVITPPIENVLKSQWFINYDNKQDDDVSKVYKINDLEDFEAELFILSEITEIENYEEFTVCLKGASNFYLDEIQDENILKELEVQKCGLNQIEMQQIIFGYGGISIHKYDKHFSFDHSFNLLLNFYKGLLKINSCNIIHRDIKPTNVLYNGEKLLIIDFGLSCHIDDVYNWIKSDFILSNKYPFNPPEFFVYYLLKKNNILKCDDIDFFLFNMNEPGSSIRQEIVKYYDKHWLQFHNEEYDISKYYNGIRGICNSIMVHKNIQDFFTSFLAKKTDVYASFYIINVMKSKTQFNSEKEEKLYTDLYEMSSVFNPENRCNIEDIIELMESFNRL
jgi:serine/threonine protein kinase